MRKAYELTPFDGHATIAIRSDENGEGGLIVTVTGKVMGEWYEVSFMLLPEDLRELLAFSDANMSSPAP